MNATFNQFENLSAENDCDRMAQMTPEECEEYNAFLDEQNARHDSEENIFPYNVNDLSDDADALASAGMGTDEDYAPDAHLESAYEDRTDLGDF